MVNGKSLDEELERIEEIFDNMTNEEFSNILIECGINKYNRSKLIKEELAYSLVAIQKLQSIIAISGIDILPESFDNDIVMIHEKLSEMIRSIKQEL